MQKVLCLDIGGSKIAYALIEEGNLLFEEKIYYDEHNIFDKEVFINTLNDLFIRYSPNKISISIAGFVKNTTILISPNAMWMNNLDFAKIFPIKEIYVENDANVFAFSQFLKTKIENLVGIVWGTGIGAGIIHKGKIFKGENLFAGEIGHAICDYKTKKTYEQLLGTEGIMKEYKKKYNAVRYPLQIYRENEELFEEYTLDALSCLLATIYQILGIKTFIFGGGIGSNLHESFYKKLKKKVTNIILNNPDKDIAILKAKTSQRDIFYALYEITKISKI